MSAEELKEREALAQRKKKVEKYFSSLNIEQDCQAMVNQLYHEQPDDVNGYAAEFFATKAKTPTVSKCCIQPRWSVSAQPGIVVKLHCAVNGFPKLVAVSDSVLLSTCSTPASAATSLAQLNRSKTNASQASVASKGSKKDGTGSAVSVQKSLSAEASTLSLDGAAPDKAASTAILLDESAQVSMRLSGCNALDLADVCNKLLRRDANPNPAVRAISYPATMATSLALLAGSSSIRNRPPMVCLLEQVKELQAETFTMPFLIIPIISGGPVASGKLKWKEFSLIPNPKHSIAQVVQNVNAMHCSLKKKLSEKTGPSAAGQHPVLGTFLPSADKPDQVMELLQGAAIDAGLTAGSDFDICVTVAANTMYDREKNKYELSTGQWKSPSDTITLLVAFLNTWPVVKMLIDPLQKDAHSDWQVLHERLRERCILVGEDVPHHRTPSENQSKSTSSAEGSLLDVTKSETSVTTSAEDQPMGHVAGKQLLLDWMEKAVNTIVWPSDLALSPTMYHMACSLQEVSANHCVVFPLIGQATASHLLLDIAIAGKCQYVRLPSPVLNPQLYEHLLSIKESLHATKKLNRECIRHRLYIPPPEPEEDGGSEGEANEE